ncbi:ATP-dependent Clp protease proteolytic subunit [Thalassotalea sp. ND16A]|uniref:ATP-dependent Clp protease proteolytic subunit n=1 Tax=Thalassotalea sp. ND16A TaxID=1535422 RepID=UPI00051D43AA|nr:ATP-dependent Clp protease proteolytic subunit [Thalassotalea sp. ND16A]KGJ96677.1 hypothetical protein ND16A_1030 [Thalassotalea sp. ND16A]
MPKTVIFITCLFLISCTSTTVNNEVITLVTLQNNDLFYRGEITKSSNQTVFELYNQTEVKPIKLIISSHGGDIEAGLTLGEWVLRNKLNIEVSRLCASSCANYVFTAGNQKYLNKDSVLLWHGSAWSNYDDHKDNKHFRDYIKPLRKREADFFAHIGVDNIITTYSHDMTVIELIKRYLGIGYKGYDFSLEDMNKLGVKNISILGDDWNWRKYRPERSNWIKRVELNNEYQFTEKRFWL